MKSGTLRGKHKRVYFHPAIDESDGVFLDAKPEQAVRVSESALPRRELLARAARVVQQQRPQMALGQCIVAVG